MYTFSRSEEGQEVQLAALVAISILAGVLVLCFNYSVELLIALLVVEHPVIGFPTSSLPSPSSPSVPPIPSRRSRSQRSRRDRELGGEEEIQPLIARSEKVFVTDSIMGTIRHLRRIGGRTAPWRGFIGAMALAFLDGMVGDFVIPKLQYWIGSEVAGRVLGGTLSLIAVSRLSLTILHIQISHPQPTTWLTRYASTPGTSVLATIPSVTLNGLLALTTLELPFLTYPPRYTPLPYILTPVSTLFLVIPSYLALTRVRSSLLGPHVDPIVPVRRVEGGVSFWKVLAQVPYARLAWFALKGLPVWLAVNGILYGVVAAAYVWVYGADGWVQGASVFGMACLTARFGL
ncbi:hypothetical protein C7212DRAFT_363543 [Tuber magnatum]|uniref:Uncharacterized protein n=1 Tax=Tuber magnatum TaxID=42249 RepID=A0A317SQ59_9PEZI|nr:hypothetical protein C7212DRAFT_363543 [Tuber magnatum]